MSQNGIGAQLRRLRHDRGWSQQQLVQAMVSAAARDGLVPASPVSLKAMLSRWENGHRAPDDYNRRLLCLALQVSPDALAPETAEPPSALRA
ncbi:helix-turn-helix domain-containing protein [Krasilnikovia sp. MM14-A1259]|uniref:helix-turn-helix domain-containing protein n=1 Tax=Krasilnikovia sp. MM14-A1259 TaxID=3373539 RepID=UPI0037FA8266